jgi:cation-transporting P-type ATPase C
MNRQKRPILSVRHDIPGRLRVKTRLLRRNNDLGNFVGARILEIPSIRSAEFRPGTGSLIVLYDADATDAQRIVQGLDLVIMDALSSSTPVTGPVAPSKSVNLRRSTGNSTVFKLTGLLVLTGFMVYGLVRRMIFRSPLSERPFSLTGFLAVVGTLPLIRSSWIDWRSGNRNGLFPFLSAACLLAVATGRAFTAVEILWILSLGRYIEETVTEKARRSVRDILEVQPRRTVLLLGDEEKDVEVSSLRRDDVVIIPAGRKIPVDGSVTQGEALVDEAHVTGRSEPELRSAGDYVFAGTVVVQGKIGIRAERLAEDTYLSKILHMAEENLENRTMVRKQADILAAKLTRIGLTATAVTFLLTRSVERSFAVLLVMSCPCATVPAVSTAIAAAVANAASRHILIKGGVHLEAAHHVDTVCFDKTGTLTTEYPRVVEVVPRTPWQTTEQILAVAAIPESRSRHPFSRAILKAAEEHGIIPNDPETWEERLGLGVIALDGEDRIVVGNEALMLEEGVNIAYFKNRAAQLSEDGYTVLFVAKNGKVQGMPAVANLARPECRETIQWLRQDGISHVCVISGDEEQIVGRLAHELEVDEFCARMMPEQKAEYIEKLESIGRKVLMVGDGVNDAPALSKASLGVAMGAGGSEVAVEAADIALAKNDLEDLVTLRKLSRHTLRVIDQNFILANTTNMAGIVLGATGLFSPFFAGLLHVGHTLAIMLNSRRILNWDPDGATLGASEGRPASRNGVISEVIGAVSHLSVE